MLHQAGRFAEAAPLYRAALASKPHSAGLRHFLGILYHQSADAEAGLRLVRQAVVMAPGHPGYSVNLVTLLTDGGKPEDAIRHGYRAIALAPHAAEPAINMATAEQSAGRHREAVARLTAVVARYPTHPALLGRLASSLETARYWAAADRARRRQLCVAPDRADAYRSLADQRTLHGSEKNARRLLVRADRAMPSFATRMRTALLAERVPESAEDIHQARRRLERFLTEAEASPVQTIADPHHEIGSTAFAFSYHDENNRDLFGRFARALLRSAPDLAWTAPHCRRAPTPGRRIRIGIISAFFGNHTIGKLYAQLLRRLPRGRFEVVAIARRRADDPAFTLQTSWADSTVMLSGDLGRDRRRVASIEADALFYLDIGMDPLTYYLAFARLAPVQFTTWGHPDTTGIPNVDHFLTSILAEPTGWEDHYSERALLLAEAPVCFPRLPALAIGPRTRPLDLPDSARIYGCPQTLFKLHPNYDHVFGEILRRDQRGHLIFIESATATETARVRARFDASCPDVADRIHLVPRMAGAGYLRFVRDCDVLLDCHAFSSGNSIFEALAMGTPVVPFNGPFMRMRVTDSIYRTIGMVDDTPTDTESYVNRALTLADNPAPARATIAACGPAAFERDSAVQILCMAVERMVDAACRGELLRPGALS